MKGISDKLAGLIKELEGEAAAEKGCGGAPTKKNDEGAAPPAAVVPDPKVEALAKSVETLHTQIAKANATIEELKRTPGVSNARPVEGEGTVPAPTTVWPSDLSAAMKKKSAKK